MKEIKKFNIIDRSLDMEKIIRTNIGLFALQERLEEEGIYVSSFGIVQCIDVYLRTLLLCNEARDRFDMTNKANTPLVLKKCTYESIEKFHQNFVRISMMVCVHFLKKRHSVLCLPQSMNVLIVPEDCY